VFVWWSLEDLWDLVYFGFCMIVFYWFVVFFYGNIWFLEFSSPETFESFACKTNQTAKCPAPAKPVFASRGLSAAFWPKRSPLGGGFDDLENRLVPVDYRGPALFSL